MPEEALHNPLVEYVHVVNRTTTRIDGPMFDSKPVAFAPGYGHVVKRDEKQQEHRMITPLNRAGEPAAEPCDRAMPLAAALRLIAQCPIMGTQDAKHPLPTQFLLGLKEYPQDFPITHIEQSDATELFNPKTLPIDRQVGRRVVQDGDGRIPMSERRLGSDEVPTVDALIKGASLTI